MLVCVMVSHTVGSVFFTVRFFSFMQETQIEVMLFPPRASAPPHADFPGRAGGRCAKGFA